MTTKTKQPRATQRPAGEALMSSAALCAATGYSRPTLSELTNRGVIKPHSIGKWPAIATLGGLVRMLRERDAGNAARIRRNDAEADSAEMDAMEKLGTLCPMDAAKQFWADSRIEIRQLIEREPSMTLTQKNALLKKIAALKPKKIEVE